MISITILIITLRLQVYLKPYKNETHSTVEFLAISVGSITIMSGPVFDLKIKNEILNTLCLSFVVWANIWFILQWSYLFVECLSERFKFLSKVSFVIGLLIWKKKKIDNSVFKKNENKQSVNEEKTRVTKSKAKRKRRIKQNKSLHIRKDKEVIIEKQDDKLPKSPHSKQLTIIEELKENHSDFNSSSHRLQPQAQSPHKPSTFFNILDSDYDSQNENIHDALEVTKRNNKFKDFKKMFKDVKEKTTNREVDTSRPFENIDDLFNDLYSDSVSNDKIKTKDKNKNKSSKRK